MTRRYVTRARLARLESSLTPRDLAVLQSVVSLRFMSGAQLQRMHFGDGDAASRAARRSLLRLTQAEVLARLPRRVGGVRAGSAGFIYAAGLAGHRLAEERGWQTTATRRRSAAVGTLFLRHCLDVAELHVRLVLADRARELELLALDAEPLCWRSYGGLGIQRPSTLKPDSFVRFGLGEYEFSYFIEVDRGTEGSRAIASKLGQYVSYHQSGAEQASRAVFPKVVWAVPDAAREEVIRDCIGRLAAPARELFAVSVLAEVMSALTGGHSDT